VEPEYGDIFDDWEVALAKKMVAQFQTDYPWLKGLDFDDLLQECLVHWHMARNRFQPGKGASRQTFMTRVLRHKLRSLLRKELAQARRTDHLAQSLDKLLGESRITLGEVIDAQTGKSDIELRIDLEIAIAKLTPLQQQICHLLAQGYPVAEVARILNKPRSTLRGEIKKIGKVFSQKDIKKNPG
jgi:RNA polymerase sigma factor (sigma-70 family)